MEAFRKAIEAHVELEPQEWAIIAKCLHHRKVKAHDHLLMAGDVCRSLALVNEGLLRSYYLLHDKEVNINFFAPHNFVTSYESFILQNPSACYIQALENTEVVGIGYHELQHLYTRLPKLGEFGRRISETALVQSQKRTESFILNTAKERYLHFIEEHRDLFNRIPLYHLATYLGIEGPSLSRIRKELSAA